MEALGMLAVAERDIRALSTARAGPILASAVGCGCPSENIPRSGRQRPEGFQLLTESAVWSLDRFSSTPLPAETDVNATPFRYRR